MSDGTRRSVRPHWLSWLSLALLCVNLAENVRAEDRVTLQSRATGAGVIGVTGQVEDFTGRRLVLREGEGRRLRVFTAEEYRILGIETSRLPAHVEGEAELLGRKFAEAGTKLREALEGEQRRWVRREILALIARSDLGAGRRDKAGLAFLKLVESDPTTPWFRLIPLRWTAGGATAETRLAARDWLREKSEVARLMGASWLLDDRGFAEEAANALRVLLRSEDPRIRDLATAQLWRLELGGGAPGEAQMRQWANRAEQIAPELRGGPLHLIGRARSIRREQELAAAAYLWEPLRHSDDPELCGRGLLEAGKVLADAAQERSAILLWTELRARFPETEWARESESLELKLRQPEAESPPAPE